MQVQPRIFEIIDSRTNQVEGTIEIGNHVATGALFFQCQRQVSWMHQGMYDLFLAAVKQEAHKNISPNAVCSHVKVAGISGNVRGALAECRCETLDRVRHPEIRASYENHVMRTIFQILGEKNKKKFHLKLALFCSGRLLGEEILLFRLLHQLKQNGYEGMIQLFFIDYCYHELNRESSLDGEFTQALGNQTYIEQFIFEMSQCLPERITLKGSFFESADHYIKQVISNPAYKHHLLIGADIENANQDMGKIEQSIGLARVKPIVLIKKPEAVICSMPLTLDLSNYPQDGESSIRLTSKPDMNLPLMIGAGVLAAALIGAAILNSKN